MEAPPPYSQESAPSPGASSRALRIVIAYGVFATLWIYLSDRALALMVSDQQMLVQWSVYKGIAFVVFTSAFLFVLTRRSFGAIERRSGLLRSTRAQLERLNHLYAALSQVGQAVVLSDRQEELFQRVCETLVREGAVSMAWIGMHDPVTQQLVPQAFFGAGSAFVHNAPIYGDDRPEGRGPSGIAFRTGRPYVCNDLAGDPGTLHWRAEAAGHGFMSCASFPVRRGVRVAGVLSVYAGEAGYFNPREVAVLEEVAMDLSFGLDNFSREDERRAALELQKRAQAELIKLNETLEHKVEERTGELQASVRRAETADRLKSAFLATMSHELRTPLNSIIGFTGVLQGGLAGPVNEEQGRQLGMVRSSARHLLELINDILDLSKIEAGELRIVADHFDLRSSLLRVHASLEPAARRSGLSFECTIDSRLRTMSGDRRRFEQVLLNLLNNAIKFTSEGAVTLHAEWVDEPPLLAGGIEAPAVRVRVSDTGIGIAKDDMAQLFQPFRQIDSGLSRGYEGTGLGLAICQRLVTLMGGTIEVSSSPGAGSCFTTTFPLGRRSQT